MMLNDKILAVMADVNGQVAEREELVEYIAIALLTRKNLFILGDTGQAKSYAINLFRKRITGAKQFERLMSKQVDEEQLFGRLDLSSLIPGSIPMKELLADVNYRILYNKLREIYDNYSISGDGNTLHQANELSKKMQEMQNTLYILNGNKPKLNTSGKIPESEIVFLDEIYKANDGILNSLLTALNERVYTNEGQTVSIPVISFFSASNEIPDFNDAAEKILRPLYDRFELKVVTNYVEEKQNRLVTLTKKQKSTCNNGVISTITLQELLQMQREVEKIVIPDSINELMDDVLCELRRKGIHISDRKYFNYYPLAQAKAYLRGGTEVSSSDLLVLKNYLWTKPEEISVISELLKQMCENPLHSRIVNVLAMADECLDELKDTLDNKRSFVKFRSELIRLYDDVISISQSAVTNNDTDEIETAKQYLENVSKNGHELGGFTYASLEELKALQ